MFLQKVNYPDRILVHLWHETSDGTLDQLKQLEITPRDTPQQIEEKKRQLLTTAMQFLESEKTHPDPRVGILEYFCSPEANWGYDIFFQGAEVKNCFNMETNLVTSHDVCYSPQDASFRAERHWSEEYLASAPFEFIKELVTLFIQDINRPTIKYFMRDTLKQLLKKYSKLHINAIELPVQINLALREIVESMETLGNELVWLTLLDDGGDIEDSTYCLNLHKVKERVEADILSGISDENLKKEILKVLHPLFNID